MFTIEVEDLETIATLSPEARCLPTLGGVGVLPVRTVPTSGQMEWRWDPTGRQVGVDGVTIEIGGDFWKFGFGPIAVASYDRLSISCRLAQLT